MISFPNGKINIGLSITEKRKDGFHNIETVMVPVNICDVLEIIISPRKVFSFTQSGMHVEGDPLDNLVCKAFYLLKKDFKFPEIEIHLHKVIPSGAGLGGGSSDAAYTIRMINQLFGLNLSESQMEDYARVLGSDCAFFIKNKTALAYGKGDVFENISPGIENYYLVIVKPDLHISTPEAYSWIEPKLKEIPLKDLIAAPMINWKHTVINDFEMEIMKRYPDIKSIWDKLYEGGALYASLTGSGAAVYGIFCEKIYITQWFPGCFVWSGYF
jgi:4-diphosphocytidyl-2-C-methyl-D-erythritol kinase